MWMGIFAGGGCSFVRAPSAEELHAVEHPSHSDKAWCDAVAPKAVDWLTGQEVLLLPRGRPLSASEGEIARQMGVQHPERVRILVVSDFPLPEDSYLATEVKKLGFGSPQAGGRSMGYAVLVKPKFEGKRWLLAHELVHVGQRERMGTAEFVRRYLLELRLLGYKRSPLELEANKVMLNAK